MKIRKILFSLISVLIGVNAAHATPAASPFPQMYVGIQGGFANTNFSKGIMIATPQNGGVAINSANINNHVFAARGYAGYQFNEYIALEAGYLRPRNTRFLNINNGTVPNGDVSEYAVDLTAKVFLPMAAYIHLSPYLKVGGAYMDAESHGGITRNAANDFGYTLHPLMGAGIGYNIMPNLIVDLSWTTITRRNTGVPKLDLIFLGLTYHFSFQDTRGSNTTNVGDLDNEDP